MQAWVAVLVLAGVALASPLPASAAPVVCAEQSSVLQCDADQDGIVDLVEETICGSATCATGAEDADGNGVADATELAESLQTGGPGGPIQPAGPDALVVVNPDGTIAEFSLWPVAGLAALVLAGLSAYVLVRHRNRNLRPAAARHSMKELVR